LGLWERGEIFGVFFGLSFKSPRPPLVKGEIFGVLRKGEVFGVWQRGRYSEAIFGSHAGKDRMPASFRKQQNIPPL
jgi:hypothetical protein